MHRHQLPAFASVTLLALGVLLAGCGNKKGGGYSFVPVNHHTVAAVLHSR